MYKSERGQEILIQLKRHGFVSTQSLAENLFVSQSSIRRDLQQLEKEGLVKRSYGGVALVSNDNILPIILREKENYIQKSAIAQNAVQLINDGDTVIMDWSTTVQHMALYLEGTQNITVFTNNFKTAETLKTNGINVFALGGRLLYDATVSVGPFAENVLNGIFADTVFISAYGMTENGDVYEPNEFENSLRLKMLQCAKRKVLLIDQSKLFRSALYRICNLSEVDYVISDCDFSKELHKKYPTVQFRRAKHDI